MTQLLTMLSMLGLLGGLYLFLGTKKPKSKSVELFGTNSFAEDEDEEFSACTNIMGTSDNLNKHACPVSHFELDDIVDDNPFNDMFHSDLDDF